jgi:hypothetical protein
LPSCLVGLHLFFFGIRALICLTTACFPLLRPVFALVFPKGVFSSYNNKSSYQVSGNSRPGERLRSGARETFRLKSRTATRVDEDDSSSTHQLADLKHKQSSDTVNKPTHDGGGIVHTVILGGGSVGHLEDDTPGVMVSNSTVIEVAYHQGSRV